MLTTTCERLISEMGTSVDYQLAAKTRVLTGDNPFNLDPSDDLLADPRNTPPLWSETMFFLIWSPEQKVGIWIHAGVAPDDKSMWWAQTFAMLPGGLVLVDRSFGRPSDNRGPDTGNLKITCLETHKRWSLTFDGAGEFSSSDELGKRVVGAGVAAAFSFDVEIEAVVPVYDMHGGMGHEIDWDMGHLHHEQGFIANGQLKAMGNLWNIDGVAIRDHSRGERHFARWGGHVWNYIVWPQSKRVLSVFSLWSPQNEITSSIVMLMENGKTELSNDFVITGMDGPGGHPHQLDLRAARVDGTEIVLHGEVQHNITMTYVEPNHNLNGVYTDPREHSEAIIADESTVRWTWLDGEVGYSNFERGFRPSFLPRTQIPLPAHSRYRTD